MQFGREAEKYLTSKVHADLDALAELVELVNPKGGTVVDIGTGAGHMAFAIAPFVDKLIATDPTPQMLQVTATEAIRLGLTNLETREARAEALPFEDESIDGVTCRVAAHHFDDVPQFVSEVARCLKSGGWFLLVDTVSPEDDDAARKLNDFESIRDPSHNRNWKISEWEKLVRDTGLSVQSVSERFKELEFHAWMDRMSVSPEDQKRLKRIVDGSFGGFREYLAPGPDSFRLLEMSLLARKSANS